MKSSTMPLSAALPGLGITLPTFWIKELRVILPIVLGCALCLVAGPALPHEFRYSLGFLLYPLTCSAVFALAFGHDYMHRTLTSALAQPVSRHKVLRTRLAICLIALLPLPLIQMAIVNGRMIWAAFFGQGSIMAVASGFEPILIALCLAPCLTILTRSVLFGTIVSMAAPYALGVFIRAVALKLGLEDGPRLVGVHLTASFTLLITGAILGYRRFITQEAIDTDVTIGRARRARSESQISNLKSQIPLRRSNPIAQLIRKELMLQRLPAGMAALCIAFVFLVTEEYAAILTIFYPASIIVLVGAIASADERRLGLIPLQVSHPIPFRSQWLIKIAVSYFTALTFGLMLPAAALLLKTDELKNLTLSEALNAAPLICGGVLLILSITIYISSISENAIRAMLASLFVIIIAMMIIGAGVNAFTQYILDSTYQHIVFSSPPATDRLSNFINIEFQVKSFAIVSLGFIPLTLYFAMQNHRYLERSGLHLFRQAAALIVYELAALAAISFTL